MKQFRFILNLNKTWFHSIIYSKKIHFTEINVNKFSEEVLYSFCTQKLCFQ